LAGNFKAIWHSSCGIVQLATFNQVYSENWEQKASRKVFKNLWFFQRRKEFKVGDKEGVINE
jgi:hypothetical protein